MENRSVKKRSFFYYNIFFNKKSNVRSTVDRQKSLFFNYNIFLIKNQIGKICRDFFRFLSKIEKILTRGN